jgi:hemerythrin superfamily protein
VAAEPGGLRNIPVVGYMHCTDLKPNFFCKSCRRSTPDPISPGCEVERDARPATSKDLSMAKPSTQLDAIDILMEDHKRVQRLFKDFEDVDRDDPQAVRDVVETACIELQIHSMLEDELFYPAVREHVPAQDLEHQDLLNQAEVEHESVEELISKLQELEPDDEMYHAYFTVIAEYVKHHIKHEEKELFPAVVKMKALDLRQLAEDMNLRREELFAEIEEAQELDPSVEDAPEETLFDSEEDAGSAEHNPASRTRH